MEKNTAEKSTKWKLKVGRKYVSACECLQFYQQLQTVWHLNDFHVINGIAKLKKNINRIYENHEKRRKKRPIKKEQHVVANK